MDDFLASVAAGTYDIEWLSDPSLPLNRGVLFGQLAGQHCGSPTGPIVVNVKVTVAYSYRGTPAISRVDT